MKRSAASPVGVGVISVITVLLVLTLSIFSALTLSTARADLALSQINADTVTAYYAADSEAASLYVDFAAGTDESLEQEIPVGDNQSLHLHLVREADGSITVLAWEVIPAAPEESEIDDTPDLWDGNPQS